MLLLLLVVALRVLDAVALTLLTPTDVLEGTNRSVQWKNGVPPYQLQVNSLNPTKNLWTYVGDDVLVWWMVSVPAGTVIQFNATDGSGVQIHNDALTVQPNPIISLESLQSITSTQSVASLSSVSVISTSSVGTQSSTTSQSASTTTSTRQSSPTHSSSGSGSNTGVMVGSVVAGILGLALIAVTVFAVLRRRRRRYTGLTNETEDVGMVYTSGYAPVDPRGSPPPGIRPDLSAYPSGTGGPTSAVPFSDLGSAPSMMTAPTNEDEEYYNRVVGRQGGYIRDNRPGAFPAIPEVG